MIVQTVRTKSGAMVQIDDRYVVPIEGTAGRRVVMEQQLAAKTILDKEQMNETGSCD